MPVEFGCDFNSSPNETCTNTAPDFRSSCLTISTAQKKFGAGSLGKGVCIGPSIYWSAFPMTVNDEGAIGIWLLYDYTVNSEFYVDLIDSGLGNKNEIRFKAANYPGTSHDMSLTMYDSGSVQRINATWSGTALTAGWQYYELNWLWNDVSGITEYSHNGTVRISDNGGDSYTRSGSTTHYINIDFPSGLFNTSYADDFVIYASRLNVGNFTAPTASQVVCSAAGGRPLTLGTPLGLPGNLGR